jgi:hypothetical protein
VHGRRSKGLAGVGGGWVQAILCTEDAQHMKKEEFCWGAVSLGATDLADDVPAVCAFFLKIETCSAQVCSN